jgi:hypothetical protein
MDDALRNALVVEVENLFAEVEVFNEGRPSRPDLKAVLIISDRAALGGGQNVGFVIRHLMQLSTLPPHKGLVVYPRDAEIGCYLARHAALLSGLFWNKMISNLRGSYLFPRPMKTGCLL